MSNSIKLDGFIDDKYILREDLVDYIKKMTHYDKESSIRWVIHELVKSGEITKVDSEYYYNGVLKDYYPKNESNRKKQLKNFIKEKYQNLDIIIYESTILNEWLNHQISRNAIFVEVNKFYMENVFTALRDSFKSNVLLNPSIDDFYLYAEDEMIIVSNLITRAPMHKDSNEIKIEKLIVDLLSSDLISEFFSNSEYDSIIDNIFDLYRVNIKKVLSYAKRRNLTDSIQQYVKKHDPREVNR